MVTVRLLLLMVSFVAVGWSQVPASGGMGKSYYAAVFLNRSRVSVGASANIGLFRRDGDSSWTNIYHQNLFTFGIGLWEKGATRRYYIAAGNGLHRSDDGRRSWKVLTSWRTEEILSLALDPVDSARLYVATPWGVFRSTDDGATWQNSSHGLTKNFVQKVLLDRAHREILYACSEDDLYKTTNSGEEWKPLRVGVNGVMTVVQNEVNTNQLVVGVEDEGVRVSFDSGKSWRRVQGLPRATFYAVTFSPDGKTIYAGGYLTGLWKSADGGQSWNLLWQDNALEAVYTVFVEPNDPRHLMVGTSGQGVFESFDSGRSWRSAGLRGCHVKQIEVYP